MKDLKKAQKRFRYEIEGLRTVAILLVVIYHIWLGRVSGGIDVFFVLSGFLITTSLISRVEKDGVTSIFSFVFNLVKRLIPQAWVVIIVTIVASLYIMPQTQWTNIIAHFKASIFYFENWRLAYDAVDYLAQGNQVSPFQHFWSLSVQFQMYIMWAVIVVISYFTLTKLCKLSIRQSLLTMLLILFGLSLTYSITETYSNQAWAYFDTFTRLWEFCIGGLLALLLPYLIWPKWLNTIVGWCGLIIICITGIILQVSTVFPGYMALVPIGGALLVLVSAENSTKFGVDKFLSVRPLTILGSLSYGIYLWHWPLLRFYLQLFETTEVSLLHGVGILIFTIGLSYITTNFVEKPIRSLSGNRKRLKSVAVVTSFGLAFICVSLLIQNELEDTKIQVPTAEFLGATAPLNEVGATENITYIPSLLEVSTDVPSFYKQKECLAIQSPKVLKCSFGVTENPDYVVALVGGSHSGHWFPTLEILAEEMNFQLDLYKHDGCRFTVKDEAFSLSDACLEWNENLIEQLKVDKPDLVFTTSTLNNREKIPDGYAAQWAKLEGITTIFGVRDNPRMKEDVPTCLEREKDSANCDRPRAEALSSIVPWENTEGLPSNVVYADLSDNFCDDKVCHSVIGNVIVYRDEHHITATYAKMLAPALKPHLQAAFETIDAKKIGVK